MCLRGAAKNGGAQVQPRTSNTLHLPKVRVMTPGLGVQPKLRPHKFSSNFLSPQKCPRGGRWWRSPVPAYSAFSLFQIIKGKSTGERKKKVTSSFTKLGNARGSRRGRVRGAARSPGEWRPPDARPAAQVRPGRWVPGLPGRPPGLGSRPRRAGAAPRPAGRAAGSSRRPGGRPIVRSIAAAAGRARAEGGGTRK